MTSRLTKELAEKRFLTEGFGPRQKYWFGFLGALLLGLVFALLDGTGRPLTGWLAYSLLAVAGLLSTLWLEGRLTADRKIRRAALTAYFVRLGFGLFLLLMLPVAGYQDSQITQAGYVFKDAYYRDTQAWDLVTYSQPVLSAFQGKYTGDQYGGLLALIAMLYRYLSPDVHRPLLILFVNAMVTAWGVLFLWKGARDWFGKSVALLAAWIFALYPESVLLGSSQMREPFIFSGIAIAFFALTEMRKNQRGWVGWLALAALILFMIHPPSGLAALVLFFLVWLLDPHRRISPRRMAIFAGFLLLAAAIVIYFWTSLPSLQGSGPGNVILTWLQHNFLYQSHLLERASGVIQKMLQDTAGQYKLAIVLGYGLAQPVLPAAIVEPAAWIWKFIGIPRALGWYLLAPLLGYALIAAIRAKENDRRRQLIVLSLAIWIWILIAAAAGGGDQWDNGRYRTYFISLEAVLAAWAWTWARARKDSWLARILLVEAAFVSVFTVWYLGRYELPAVHLTIWTSIALALVLGAIVLAGSWLWERRRLR